MFTVLIAEKEHIDAIRQENNIFFEPFLNNKNLAFCYWNPMGQNLQEAVPELLDAVGYRREWRVVIINNCTIKSSKLRNPFDMVNFSELDSLESPSLQPMENESIDKWILSWEDYYNALTDKKESIFKSALELPLQKLATWLCFKPEDYIHKEIQEKQDVHDWAMEMIGRDDMKSSLRLELLERSQYKRELRLKEKLRKNFINDTYLDIIYPSEVYCISPRSAEKNYFDPDIYWNIRQDSQYSQFTDRNMYFDKMRFMVFDMLSYTHRNFRSDYLRFLASVLILSSNSIPSSAMQSRRLYQIDVETDDHPLCVLVTSYDKKLSNTYDVIENEMEKIRCEIPGELTDKAVEELFCTSKDINVILDESCNPEKLVVEEDFGLFFDSPENESTKWNRDYNKSKKELLYIAKQQSRAVRKSVNQMNNLNDISEHNISRLTTFQIDDIKDYTNTSEDTMVELIPPDITDPSLYLKRIDNASKEVEKNISKRMTRKKGSILSLMCLGLCLICFMPFIYFNISTSQTINAAIIISVLSLVFIAIVLFVSLLWMRYTIRKSVKNYNKTANEIINDIQLCMTQYSKYLSASFNVRRGHAVQNYVQKNLDEYTKSLRIRKKHQEEIRRRKAILEERYSDYLKEYFYCDETMSCPYEYDFDKATEYSYPAPFLAGDCRQIEYISKGNYITVPSSYVTSLLVRMESIYEK